MHTYWRGSKDDQNILYEIHENSTNQTSKQTTQWCWCTCNPNASDAGNRQTPQTHCPACHAYSVSSRTAREKNAARLMTRLSSNHTRTHPYLDISVSASTFGRLVENDRNNDNVYQDLFSNLLRPPVKNAQKNSHMYL